MVYQAAFKYRNQHQYEYSVDDNYALEPWTGSQEMINALQVQLESTIQVMQKLKDQFNNEPSFFNDSENIFNDPAKLLHHLKLQLCDLSHFVLASLNDRRNYLSNVSSSPHIQQQSLENYQVVLNNIVKYMLEFSMIEEAFVLAETFKEMETLVQLTMSLSDRIIKIKSYLVRFGEPFAIILFQSYHSKGLLKDLMDQDQYCSEYLYRFLSENGYGYLSWIQDIGYGRFQSASETLWGLSEKETYLKQQSLSIAISKLAYLEAHSEIPADQVQDQLKSFDIAMDMVVAQRVALEQYKQILVDEGYSNFEKIDSTVDTLLKASFEVSNYRIRKLLLKRTLMTLFEGRKATVGSLLDLFTFQKGSEQYLTVLELLLHGKMDFEETLDYRIHLLWKNVWLSDNWVDIRTRSETLSDSSLLEVLKETNAYQLYEWLCIVF
jgi:hypothetical protein